MKNLKETETYELFVGAGVEQSDRGRDVYLIRNKQTGVIEASTTFYPIALRVLADITAQLISASSYTSPSPSPDMPAPARLMTPH